MNDYGMTEAEARAIHEATVAALLAGKPWPYSRETMQRASSRLAGAAADEAETYWSGHEDT